MIYCLQKYEHYPFFQKKSSRNSALFCILLSFLYGTGNQEHLKNHFLEGDKGSVYV